MYIVKNMDKKKFLLKLNSIVKKAKNREQMWLNILNNINHKNICEVGVWKGDFANTLLENLPKIKKYRFIDPYRVLPDWNKPLNKSNKVFSEARREALKKNKKFIKKIVEHRLTTKKASKHILDNSQCFIYIDGDHTLKGITIDLNNMLRKLNKNGVIGGDDFTKNIWQHGMDYDPTFVFPYAVYFAEANDLVIVSLPFKQFLMFKSKKFAFVDYENYKKLSYKKIFNKPFLKIIFYKKFIIKFFDKLPYKIQDNLKRFALTIFDK